MKLLAIGASTSSKSINRTFAAHAASLVAGAETHALDLNDFEMPIFSVDREEADGIPDEAKAFVAEVAATDAIVLSLAEHNGSYSAAFKNILDWASRHERELWANKPMLLLSTSPGARGGATVLGAATTSFPHLGANIVASLSLPSFYKNFADGEGVRDSELKADLASAVRQFAEAIGT